MGLDIAGIGAVADLGSKLLDVGGKVFDRIIPDKAAAQKAKDELAAQFATQEFQLALGQIQINVEEAKSTNWWVAGWRPGIGWICGVILALTYIPKAIALTAFWCVQVYLTFAHPETKLPGLPEFPNLGVTDVLGILGTLLGSAYIAKLRTDEKKADAEGNR